MTLSKEQQEFWDNLAGPTPNDRDCKNCAHWKDKMGCSAIAYDVMHKCINHTRWEYTRFPSFNPNAQDYNIPKESFWKWDQKNA